LEREEVFALIKEILDPLDLMTLNFNGRVVKDKKINKNGD